MRHEGNGKFRQRSGKNNVTKQNRWHSWQISAIGCSTDIIILKKILFSMNSDFSITIKVCLSANYEKSNIIRCF